MPPETETDLDQTIADWQNCNCCNNIIIGRALARVGFWGRLWR